MELDDVDPANWAKLQAAAEEYCTAHAARFEELAELLNRAGTGGEGGGGVAGSGSGAGEEGEEAAAVGLASPR